MLRKVASNLYECGLCKQQGTFKEVCEHIKFAHWKPAPDSCGESRRVRGMNRELQNEIRKWDNEVDNKTAELISAGIAPYDAVQKAVQAVIHRRAAAREKGKRDDSAPSEGKSDE